MAVKFKDYYESLGVTHTATPAAIKKAYRKLALVHHPDVAKDKSASEALFREINEAYHVLSDPEKRKKFDELGANWDQPVRVPPHPTYSRHGGHGDSDGGSEFEGTGFSDFFDNYFGGHRDGFDSSQRAHPQGEYFSQRGQDVETDLLVTLSEVLHGATRKLSLRRPAERGSAERTNTYNVKIPKGVQEGQQIRLGGQGGLGYGNGAMGDLFLRVRLAKHPDFLVQDSDLIFELDLAPWEAVLGVKVSIPALDGETSLKVPAGTDAGSQLRLRGLGLPKDGTLRGDLLATIRIQIPPSITLEERALWEQLAVNSTFNPRSPL